MNLKETLGFCCSSLWQQKLRSFLTVLGMIIGISSIILLVGLAEGLKEDVLEELELWGPRTIVVVPVNIEGSSLVGPASGFIPTTGLLFEKDYDRLKRIGEIKTITKVLRGRTTIVFKGQAIDTEVWSVEPEVFRDVVEFDIGYGRYLEKGDRYAAVVGSEVAESFDEDIKIQSNIYIKGRRFTVVGILERTGSAIVPWDDVILVPFSEGREIYGATMAEGEVSAIRMTVKEGVDVEEVADEVNEIMLSSHHVTEEEKDFGVVTPSFINQQYASILDLLTVFLGAIASISLIVGGIGISNTMFMSVMERRREIGTMKAVGFSHGQIRNIFLIESGIIGLLGGLLGLALAAVMGLAMIYIAATPFIFEPLVITGALLFSIVVGIISGTFPAMEAARVTPMMALRYE